MDSNPWVMQKVKIRYYLPALALLFLGLSSCGDQTRGYSDVPAIQLLKVETVKGALGKDSLLEITFSYTDGDGDIGLTDGDTLPPYNAGSQYQYNLLVYIWEYSNGQRIPIQLAGDKVRFSRRIPDIQPTGKIKEISGEMTVRYDARPLILYPDTVVCELTLVDRALNMSNTIKTNPVPLEH